MRVGAECWILACAFMLNSLAVATTTLLVGGSVVVRERVGLISNITIITNRE